jgi:hypothetical protein
VSDVEHELVTENSALRERADLLRDVALRSTVAAIHAEEAVGGRHDAWLDEAMTTLLSDEVAQPA